MTKTPHPSSLELATRLGTLARVCEVVRSTPVSTSLQEVTLRGGSNELTGLPGNDVMILVGSEPGHIVRRRYSVRSVDTQLDEFTLWISTSHQGAGSHWARSVGSGELVDIVGPRGKILLNPLAQWHLFIGDVSGLSAFYRMAQSIDPPGYAIFIVEIDHDDDARTAIFPEGVSVTGIFVDRQGRALHDPAGLLSGLAAFTMPATEGHAYLFGEFSVIKVVRTALLDRGLNDQQISRKVYWRMGRQNAAHGEAEKGDD